MKKVMTQDEAISCISEIQEILYKIDYHSRFCFVFKINKDKEFVLKTESPCDFLMKGEKNVSCGLKFVGPDIASATNRFIDFFLNGGEAIILANEDGYQLHIEFHYGNDGWVIDKSHCGSYNYHD